MARKSKRNSKQQVLTNTNEKKTSGPISNQLLTSLLDKRAKGKNQFNNGTKEIKEADLSKYKTEFQNIFKAFSSSQEEKVLLTNEKSLTKTEIISDEVDTLTDEDSKEADKSNKDYLDGSEYEKEISRNKLRKISKVTLAELKSSVPYPQVIEWYDCDAHYPLYLADIKSSKNIVPVPSNWQVKREYLSGRSSLEKKPFDLPDLIKETKIEEMRNILNVTNEDEKSLKELSRASVQPKTGSLDIDLKNLHDIFFKIGVNWKPKSMLSFGDLYYEKRNLDFEEKWNSLVDEKKPGKISDDLRNALGLQEGQLPPWCLKIQQIGLPPSYPNFKIAGINWDIKNISDNIYGTNDILSSRKSKTGNSIFGELMKVEYNNDNVADEAGPVDPTLAIYEDNDLALDEAKTKVHDEQNMAKPLEHITGLSNVTDKNKSLYKIINESNAKNPDNRIAPSTSYHLTENLNVSDPEIEINNINKIKDENEEYSKKFKF
ncbi:hypothetical protein TPHA_0G01180 [Tetrapisispora phaffii CBS 4417]|uniref:PSP proline-rich domain-containing protein n=1 Tax=Tetrapisispora phaffii (strain ATCC 24235 / CBS 4417 / NBRC 1672 / NRRL Y-8282 / UCD 70-5) TaxID=1071381 RepID=G8BVM7_TETPH|nr:hypothetical protein TPHA_0G01180 [Tetrapisispora phaffii CBS 4417]CCE63955.1 hypothetical protein TPHA_0G01180 [Tetrapisispora phaffii CBS 4417]